MDEELSSVKISNWLNVAELASGKAELPIHTWLQVHTLFFFLILFILNSFIFGYVGSSLLRAGFL